MGKITVEKTPAGKVAQAGKYIIPSGAVAVVLSYFITRVDPSIPVEVVSAMTAILMAAINSLAVFVNGRIKS